MNNYNNNMLHEYYKREKEEEERNKKCKLCLKNKTEEDLKNTYCKSCKIVIEQILDKNKDVQKIRIKQEKKIQFLNKLENKVENVREELNKLYREECKTIEKITEDLIQEIKNES